MSLTSGISSFMNYGVLGNTPVFASYRSGHSVNVGDTKIPGGNGIAPVVDEFIPSFPGNAQFRQDDAATVFGKTADDNNASDNDIESKDASELDGDEKDRAENGERDTGELTPDEQRIVANLQQRDREVRAHEQAHISAGGAYVRGGASYEYENGPDNKRYAVGGEVSIDASPVRDNPEATIAKMQVVRAAALAPAEPSGQDRSVAASASRAEANARVELREKKNAEAEERRNEDDNNKDDGKDTDANVTNGKSRATADAIEAYTSYKNPTTTTGGINFAA